MRVCLDAGHYGKYNQSPVNPLYFESERMWQLTEYLFAALKNRGAEVIRTRTDKNKDLTLTTRGKKAAGCDLFISMHSNASTEERVDYPVAITMLDGSSTDIGYDLAKVVAKTMGTKQAANNMIRVGSTGGEYYGVLRGAKSVGVPGLILEHSFHTNKKATAWLMSNANLKKLAEAEAECIYNYLMEDEEVTQEQFNKMMDAYLLDREKLPASSWAVKEIASAKNKGITDGSAPRGFVTREECMAMVDRLANKLMK